MSERRGTKALETWCRRLTEGYPGVKVENMTTSWRDGLAFCAIIHHFRPDLIDFASLNPANVYYNNSLAFNIADRQLGIPALLDAEDMVLYTVPDRLSILTYLSQFYRVFGNQTAMPAGGKQGSPQRIVPKRSAISSDRGILSPASSSPPTKVSSRPSLGVTGSGLGRREPCAKCGFPVFLAERLNVGTKLYHRTCFRCARCNNQLSLANCYETETDGQYCCETCPDEEEQPSTKITKFDSLDNVKSIINDNNLDLKPEEAMKKFNSSDSLSQATDTKKLTRLDQVRNRSLSDEEKSKGLQKFDDDEYSADFENALEDTNEKIYQDSLLSKARNHFLSTHLLNEDLEDAIVPQINIEDDTPPPLPESKPPDIISSTASLTNEEIEDPVVPESSSASTHVNTVDLIPKEEIEDSPVNSTNPSSNEDQRNTASDTNLREKNIAKDTNRSSLVKSRMLLFEVGFKDNNSTTSISKDKAKAVSKYFNNKIEEIVPLKEQDISLLEDTTVIEEATTVTDSTAEIEEIKTEPEKTHYLSMSSETLDRSSQSTFKTVSSDVNFSDSVNLYSSVIEDSPLKEEENILSKSIIEDIIEDSSVKEEENILSKPLIEDSAVKEEENILSKPLIEDTPVKEEEIILSKSIIEDSSVNEEENSLNKSIVEDIIEDSPLKEEENILSKSIIEDLSGDQSIVALTMSILEDSRMQNEKYPNDLNPFGDEIEEPPNEALKRNIIKPSMEDLTIITPPSKEEKRKSTNPFGSSDEEDEDQMVVKQKPPRPPLPASRSDKKVLEAPKVNLNPFWSDGEENSEEEIAVKPVPMPRSKHLSTPEPRPRLSGLSNNASQYDSNSSLSSMNSSIGHTPGKRKKPPPPPPPQGLNVSPEGSKQSSPSTSTHPSPKLTPRVRKHRKAPLPPTSTPFVPSNCEEDTINVSPITKPDGKSDGEEAIVLNPASSDIEKEKISKDEKNRNRQSQTMSSPGFSDSDSLSQQCSSSTDKSTHGKWKRKKGPAPARPVPQRRQIRPLPLLELRRELDIIEMQQQGLEKQGVKLEQLIREQCEGPGTTDETALTPEVEDLVLELFELVNEKNELFRRQAELMYLRRQQRLEEEHADLEYQIRCLMERPERNKTDSDKAREEELINRLLQVVERRNEIVDCLEMDRVREAEEDQSINFRLSQLASKKEEENHETPVKLSKKEKKKMKKEKKLKEKGKNLDADKDIDESETSSTIGKDKKKKKWF